MAITMSRKWSKSLVLPWSHLCCHTPDSWGTESVLSPDLTTSINCHPGAMLAIQCNTGNSNGPEDKSHHVYSDGHALYIHWLTLPLRKQETEKASVTWPTNILEIKELTLPWQSVTSINPGIITGPLVNPPSVYLPTKECVVTILEFWFL